MAFIPTRSSAPTPAAPTSIFPTYLLPSIPFRRRQSSNSSIMTSSSSPSSSPPGPSSLSSILGAGSPSSGGGEAAQYLHGHKSYLRCARCSTDLALTSQIISKGFTGRHGRAYLVSGSPVASAIASTPYASGEAALPNTQVHKPVPRQLVTGAHTVSDISCMFCGSVLGWQYVAAEEESQRYKVGKFILETKKVVAYSTWENDEDDAEMSGNARGLPPSKLDNKMRGGGAEDVEFDSQDEDECEDLFAGVWSPALAERRRRGRRFLRRSGGGSGAGGERARSEDF